VKRAVALVALVLLAAGCSSGDPFSSLPKPKTVVTEPTTTTTEPDLTGVPLRAVDGATTTTIAVGPGPLTIVGKVEGPDGAVVGGAIVQLERIVGDAVATARVPTAADGTWNLEKALGGRYRIRAWRTPDLATLKPEIVFLESGPERAVSLHLDAVGGVRVDSAIAPDPPVVDEEVNLKVRVAERSVDRDGVVRDVPVAGEFVTLSGSGDWSVESPNPSTTGGDGSTIFRLTCGSAGSQPLFATLSSSGASYPLVVQPCIQAATSTTSSSSSSTTSTTER
jgi:hypothetical protein